MFVESGFAERGEWIKKTMRQDEEDDREGNSRTQ
jgi:hypothetical protein